MISYMLLVIFAYLIIMWLFALIYADENKFPNTFLGEPLSPINQFCLGIFYFPFQQLKRIIKAIIKFIVEVLFEMIFMGILQFIWFLIRGFFMLILRLFDA
ncbi:hypothetical protein [Acinetobacter sp. CFCC 10889]|uniref:hypothetical protein n=1 Tax=Acinetobacter sp. CFCC 10889 TaxID=1775557 RepID=UPI000DD0704E|nr:hypothetical protein [Acinetobacter sp. CFCC 10889]